MEQLEAQEIPITKVAFLFPGQGTQYVGMGKTLYEGSLAAREVLDEIDDALGFHLTQLMFNGLEQDLAMTLNAQPAIFAVSLACFAAMKEINKDLKVEVNPAYVAGHSLGEYTALVASNSLKIRDAARLVRERGQLMQNASNQTPSGLAAIIGLDEITVEEICRETGANISTVNSLEQIVIGGSNVALVRAMDLCSARGAKKNRAASSEWGISYLFYGFCC
ncbi:ACP S-malonyltransferase [SAR202 cluster bacterium AD-802-E10_MRT_200m]|nr:ACP S-malonyltransferase [SAR202 cluster bacterium AD-802-E10_MRT_200m]